MSFAQPRRRKLSWQALAGPSRGASRVAWSYTVPSGDVVARVVRRHPSAGAPRPAAQAPSQAPAHPRASSVPRSMGQWLRQRDRGQEHRTGQAQRTRNKNSTAPALFDDIANEGEREACASFLSEMANFQNRMADYHASLEEETQELQSDMTHFERQMAECQASLNRLNANQVGYLTEDTEDNEELDTTRHQPLLSRTQYGPFSGSGRSRSFRQSRSMSTRRDDAASLRCSSSSSPRGGTFQPCDWAWTLRSGCSRKEIWQVRLTSPSKGKRRH